MIRLACERPADSEVPLARWSSSRARARGCRARGLRADLRDHRLALALRGRDQAVAVPLLDLPARPRLHRQGRPDPRPLRRPMGRRAAAPRRLRRLLRRETLDPSPRPQTLHAARRAARQARPARRARVRPARRALLLRRLGRAPREAVRPLRRQGRDRPVRRARRAVHERRAVQQGPRVFVIVDNGSAHRGKRSIRPPPRRLHEPDPRPHPRPRQLAQPGRDLLLDRPAQGPDPQRLPRPRTRSSSSYSRSAAATSRSPHRSSGSSPAPTSTASPNDSTYPPPKPPDRIRRRTSEPEH